MPAEGEFIYPKSAYPRRLWLRALGLFVIIYVAVIGGTIAWWQGLGPARLDRRIAEYRVAGQPVLIDDFQPAPVPNDQNGYIDLRQAFRAMNRAAVTAQRILNRALGATDAPGDATDTTPADPKPAAIRLVEMNRPALDRIRAARFRPHAINPTQLTSPVLMMSRPNVDLTPLAQLAADAAEKAHAEGRDQDAVEYLLDELGVARVVGRSAVSMLDHMLAARMAGLACRSIQDLAPALRIDVAAQSQPGRANPAGRDQIVKLIRDLRDDAWMIESARKAIFFERLGRVDACLARTPTGWGGVSIFGGGLASALAFWQPIETLDVSYGMRMLTELADAFDQPAWPQARARIPRFIARDTFAPSVVHLVSLLTLPAFDRAIETDFGIRTRLRLTAVALAIRLYELDHGVRPPELSALVPDYLPGIPRDLMSAAERPPQYRPDQSPPLLYSVGPNGVDNGGRERSSTSVSDGPAEPDDIVVYLEGSRPPRPAPKSTRPDSPSENDDPP